MSRSTEEALSPVLTWSELDGGGHEILNWAGIRLSDDEAARLWD